MTWSEGVIARSVAYGVLNKKCVVLVDRCNWTGHECDVLAVTTDLRVIDVEIKISRADFKKDAAKDKWWHRPGWRYTQPKPEPTHRPWPPRVWKHYIAMPKQIWSDDLLEFAPSDKSGILLMQQPGSYSYEVKRAAKPNKDAERLTPAQAVDVARLANIRMWEAYGRLG